MRGGQDSGTVEGGFYEGAAGADHRKKINS